MGSKACGAFLGLLLPEKQRPPDIVETTLLERSVSVTKILLCVCRKCRRAFGDVGEPKKKECLLEILGEEHINFSS